MTTTGRCSGTERHEFERSGSASESGLAPLGPLWAAAVAGALLAAGAASADVVAELQRRRHEGVSTCAGAPCHGRTSPGELPVLQNEYSTWIGDDRHAEAYAVLLNPLSKRMARNLGLNQPAHKAKICLDCHADNVPAELRGRKFDIEDGVGCEACHGGSQNWLEEHDGGRPHEQNVADGLFPSDEPGARAELCLSCHLGTEDRFVTHRLMGAGHPRQSFELHLFTQIQPAHYVIDDDYRERGKTAPDGMQVWAIGQAVTVREIARALTDSKRNRDGVWPEFVLYDCHACHHPMSDRRWRSRPSAKLPPGIGRLEDGSFLMLRHALKVVNPDAAGRLRKETAALHRATVTNQARLETVARRIESLIDEVLPQLEGWTPSLEDVKTLARSITNEGKRGEYSDYAGAEQATMAIQDLADSLYTRGALEGPALQKVGGEIRKLLATTQDPEKFDPAEAKRSFAALGAAFP